MPSAEIEEILLKYHKAEEKIDKLLNVNRDAENTAVEDRLKTQDENKVSVTLEEAKARNRELLQELEIIKGNLRSKAIFSPAELQWEQICKRYRDEPSLPVTTWKCHLPVFV